MGRLYHRSNGDRISADVSKCKSGIRAGGRESDPCGKNTWYEGIWIFWKVAVPSAGPGIVAGTILTFARALGEYGATSMLAGNIPGKTGTISQRIAMVVQDGDYMTAGVWVMIVMLVAFVLILFMNLVSGRNMKNIRRW